MVLCGSVIDGWFQRFSLFYGGLVVLVLVLSCSEFFWFFCVVLRGSRGFQVALEGVQMMLLDQVVAKQNRKTEN